MMLYLYIVALKAIDVAYIMNFIFMILTLFSQHIAMAQCTRFGRKLQLNTCNVTQWPSPGWRSVSTHIRGGWVGGGRLTRVRLDGLRGRVRQVLEHLDLWEGQVAGEQGHDLDVRPVCGVGRHGHGHHAGALATHRPVATAVGHCMM